MTSSRSWLPQAAVLWLPPVLLVGGLVVMGVGVHTLADESRSAGLFPGRVVATDDRTANVEYTGPDGRATTATVGLQKPALRLGAAVRIRAWPDARRAELDHGVSHGATIVVGSVLALLGAAATVLAFVRHHRERSRS
ncbi:hypothetical protein Q5425_44565 [Amycolatopsis sp. A133]|uniref:hypothetical protein n=1 Tax=Amycolatopsis sp. A133 TaxID=3064472 RepID=UPI0027FDC773|nr:hypothetical protein [Amycolatopsis sp. A133]MDQ7810841.1 hypothetical protein [Amycolatopsis sp. A133]